MSEAFDALLDQRAQQLARPVRERATGQQVQLLRLRVGENRYALRAHFVDGVTPWRDWTRVPGAPPTALGVIAWRGAIVVVLDLGRKMGQEGGELQHVVVLEKAGRRVGLAVGNVDEVVTLAERLAPPVGLSPQVLPLLEGVFDDGTALLDAATFLGQEALRAL